MWAYGIRPTNRPIRGRTNSVLTHFLSTSVGAYGIRPKNAHDHGQMIHPPDTRGCVFYRYIPKRDTYLLDTYLSIPILDEDGVAQKPLIQKPGTFWDVCCCTIPIWIKKSILFYSSNRLPGTRGGVCNTPLPIRIKNWIPSYLLNRLPGTFLDV